MDSLNKIKQEGISLRTVHAFLIVLAVLVSLLLIFATFHSSSTFTHLSEATDEYIELQHAAYELMDASDYLTEMVQRFTSSGDRSFMDSYFTEAFETERREDAIHRMSVNPNSAAALEKLETAMENSVALMDREYYAMKLVVEAEDIRDYPPLLDDVTLTAEDQALSPDEKMDLAQTMVLDDEYYATKGEIRDGMKACLAELEKLTNDTQANTSADLRSELLFVRIVILIQAVGIMFMIWLTARLGINPILKAVDKINDDSPLPVIGANEFRYLAKTYNKMYEVYKKSVAHLNYKASHDELTKTYNRAGYDLLLSSIDRESTYMLLFDADHFKEVNDTYGHEVGDKVLQRIAGAISGNFRSDDYICRIGGDEFVVLMVHSDERQANLIVSKVEQINRELEKPADGLPSISVSVGIAHGKFADSPNELFEHADSALYETKRNGRRGHSFYDSTLPTQQRGDEEEGVES